MQRDRFEALDAWRGVCAVVVALEHLNIDSVIHRNALVHHGFRFVDFFFVLSGFVIAHAYRGRLCHGWAPVRAFLIRRVGRLWPLHVSLLVVLGGVQLGIELAQRAHLISISGTVTERNTLESLLPNIFLVHAWGGMHYPSWNTPSWSISTEMFAYGLFALACVSLKRWIEYGAALLLAAAAVLVAFVVPYGMKATYDYGLARCVFGFMAGVLVRWLWGRVPSTLGTAGEIVAAILVVCAVVFLPFDASGMLVTPVFAFTIWVFASERGALSRLLRRPWGQALGRWSYSIYMVHFLVVLCFLLVATGVTKAGLVVFGRTNGVATLIGPAPLTDAIAIAYLACVVAIASQTYRVIELRGQRLFAAWANRT